MSGVGGHLLGSVSHDAPVQDSRSPYLGQRPKGRWGGWTGVVSPAHICLAKVRLMVEPAASVGGSCSAQQRMGCVL